ncbi:hypothetical protein EG328_009517 [Venturia inaequalis]|uniref:CoA-binding domain-containing protein n=2 Tax=Venturia inaequalis TaxID=5025 RepID=A0A8H3U8V7_VENIN|nr:hypothetical protein EG328_009517 [Venturia inaequalis]
MLSKTMEKSLKTFFSSPQFAVIGASSDPTKFGHKVFVWYLTHSLPVTPINPRAPSISVKSKTYATLTSPSQIPHPEETSLSIITPPKATLQILKEAREAGIPAVWLQPGTYDDEVLREAKVFEQGGGVAQLNNDMRTYHTKNLDPNIKASYNCKDSLLNIVRTEELQPL